MPNKRLKSYSKKKINDKVHLKKEHDRETEEEKDMIGFTGDMPITETNKASLQSPFAWPRGRAN